MSIIVEDGTGLSTAETYISTEDCDTYHAARGASPWSVITTAQKEQALRRAVDYMTASYRSRWQGARYTETQALDWPRVGVIRDSWSVAIDEIPEEVKRACAELAYRAAAGDLAPDLTQGVISEQVGPLKVEYDRTSPQVTRYRAIDAMLRPFLKSGGGCSFGLVRT